MMEQELKTFQSEDTKFAKLPSDISSESPSRERGGVGGEKE